MYGWREMLVTVAVCLLAGALTGLVLRACGLGEAPLWLW